MNARRLSEVHCECGEWSGERCAWHGPKSETVLVEYMPEQHRSSHEAAGNRGTYPANGAHRIRVERSCADTMIETDGDWVHIVAPGLAMSAFTVRMVRGAPQEDDRMITAKDLAVEVVRVSQMGTLRRAALNESLTDVIGVHAGVLRGRLGTWDSRTELDAVAYLTEAVQEAVDSADFQDHDDAEIEESDLIERIMGLP